MILKPTPRTKAIARDACDDTGRLCRPELLWSGLERFERELAEAKEELKKTKSALKQVHIDYGFELCDPNGTIWEAAEKMQQELTKAIQDKDNAESDRKQAEVDTLRAMHERNEALEQLDSWQRLALSSEMLRKKAEEQRNQLAKAAKAVVDRGETPLWKNTPHTGEFIRALADALDAIEGGQP